VIDAADLLITMLQATSSVPVSIVRQHGVDPAFGEARYDELRYAELAGHAMTTDAFHVTSPHPGGEGMIRAMRGALAAGTTALTGRRSPPFNRWSSAALRVLRRMIHPEPE